MADVLRLVGLSSGYGAASIVTDVSLTLAQGRAIALLGRNGVGKTTLVDTIVGVTRRHAGKIYVGGLDVTTMPPEKRAAAGVGWVPQERNIFKSLTVVENLTAVARPGHWTVPRIFEIFPRLAARKANLGSQLSGGEQQMLAIARALMLNPKLLLLDEPTEGLAPIIVEDLLRVLTRLFRCDGMSGIIVEQHAQKILGLTDDAVILERGRIVHQGPSAALLADGGILEHHLGIGRV